MKIVNLKVSLEMQPVEIWGDKKSRKMLALQIHPIFIN
jgi:hypothetical protein